MKPFLPHEKHSPGVFLPTLTTCAMLLSTACGGAISAEEDAATQPLASPLSTSIQRVEGNSCAPDVTPPVITCAPDGGEVECGGYIDYGDVPDLDVSDNCGISGVGSETVWTGGGEQTVYVHVGVTDTSNNSASCSTRFTVVDTEAPGLWLNGPTQVELSYGQPYVEPGADASDACDNYGGSADVQITGTVDSHIPGTYLITYRSSDRKGNTATKTRQVKVLPPASGSAPTASTRFPRLRHTATLLPNGRVLVTGGYTRTAEEFDPGTESWVAVGAPIATHRTHTATLLSNGTVLVAGGAKSGSASVEELYDPTSGQWSPTGRMSTPRYGHTAERLPDGRILVVGGGTSEGTSPVLATAEVYDPSTGEWTATGALNTARRDHTTTLVPGLGVLVTGGLGTDGAPLASSELYDFTTGTWTGVGEMHAARSGHTATRVNGRVLVLGGATPDASGTTYKEAFDPATSTWSVQDRLWTARQHHTATLVGDTLFIAGGYQKQMGILTTTEVEGPQGPPWRTPLVQDRYKHTATLLEGGRVLFVGGYSSGDPSAQSAELYYLVP